MADINRVPEEFKSLFEQLQKTATDTKDTEQFPGANELLVGFFVNSCAFIEADRIMDKIEPSEEKNLFHKLISIAMRHDARLNALEISKGEKNER